MGAEQGRIIVFDDKGSDPEDFVMQHHLAFEVDPWDQIDGWIAPGLNWDYQAGLFDYDDWNPTFHATCKSGVEWADACGPIFSQPDQNEQ